MSRVDGGVNTNGRDDALANSISKNASDPTRYYNNRFQASNQRHSPAIANSGRVALKPKKMPVLFCSQSAGRTECEPSASMQMATSKSTGRQAASTTLPFGLGSRQHRARDTCLPTARPLRYNRPTQTRQRSKPHSRPFAPQFSSTGFYPPSPDHVCPNSSDCTGIRRD